MADQGFGVLLRAAMEDQDVSAEQLGRRLGYETRGRLVRKWLSGTVTPSYRNIVRISEALAVPVDRLVAPIDAETTARAATSLADALEDGAGTPPPPARAERRQHSRRGADRPLRGGPD